MKRLFFQRHLLKLAQIPGMMPPPNIAPMGGAPGAPEEANDDSALIPGPIDCVEKLLIDSDIKRKLAEPDEFNNIILEIWKEYGGKEDGSGAYPNKKGERSNADEDRDVEQVKKERELNEDAKWKRLPTGRTMETLENPISFKLLSDSARKMVWPIIQEMRGQSGGGGAPGGMPGGLPI